MSFLDHLEELRRTLFWLLGIAAVTSCGAWFVSQRVLDALVPPGLGKVYFSSPSEGFMVRMKASIAIGLVVAFPLLLARLWSFVAPGLFRHEKRAVVPVMLSGAILFYGGIAFGYYAVIPRMLDFFLSFSGERLAPLLNVTQYFFFVAKFALAFGIAFQLPLVLVLLSALGLVTPQRLLSQWRYGVIVIFVIAAWLTPPDVVSQILMGGPLVLLYLLSIGASFLFARKRRRSSGRS
jgi:sec-independent protein translocase protein TatC